MAGLKAQEGGSAILVFTSKGRVMGDVENLCRGKAQSGITISTCLDRMLEESPIVLLGEKVE